MLEISHKQAQYLIRQSLDARAGDGRRLPEGQWSALQAHLEGCEECRAYRERAARMEKRLRQTLLGRWHSVQGPKNGLEMPLTLFLRVRRDRQGMWARSGMRALALLVVGLVMYGVILGGQNRLGTTAVPVNTPTQEPSPTPEPTLPPGERFDGVVIYEGRGPFESEGPTDIYLLRTGPEEPEISNMTLSPEATDSHPIWSPDGEWIAFLSDRTEEEGPPGKTELWVMTVAGSRLTRLTDTPGIAWEGPPAWSLDGQWVALVGRRLELDNIPWVYLIPLSGEGESAPVALPDTRGVTGPLRFSPNPFTGDQSLLYRAPDQKSIRRFNLSAGISEDVTEIEEGYTVGEAFEMRAYSDFIELVYTLEGPEDGLLRRNVESPLRSRRTYTLERLVPGAAKGLSLVPGVSSVAYLGAPDGEGCQDISVWQGIEQEPYTHWTVGVCVLGGFDQQQMRVAPSKEEASWALLPMKDQENGRDSLYAFRIPHQLRWSNWPQPQLLDEAPGMTGPPRVRPLAAVRLEIRPQAALPALGVPPPVEQVPFLQGEVYLALQEGKGSRIVAMQPDGSTMRSVLPPAEDEDPLLEGDRYQCPALSPDGEQLAFLAQDSDDPLDLPLLYELHLEDRQLYWRHMPHLLYASYDCPVWSPDGQALAVVVRAFGIGYLAIFQPDKTVPVYMTVNLPSEHALPVWSADGSRLYLAAPRKLGFSPGVLMYEWNAEEGELVARDSFLAHGYFIQLDGWDDVQAFSISPNGEQMAMVVVQDRPARVEMRVYRVSDQRIVYRKQIRGYDPGSIPGVGRIAWMQSGQVVFAQYGSALDPFKAQLWRYDPAEDTVQNIAATEDVLYDWAIQSGWLVYSTESGLWADSIPGRMDPLASPILLDDGTVNSMDWR